MEMEKQEIPSKPLSLVEAFSELPDPRVVGRSKHDLVEMWVVVVCALTRCAPVRKMLEPISRSSAVSSSTCFALIHRSELPWRLHGVGLVDNTEMPLIHLTPTERTAYRSAAHHLDPVVMVGQDGLTPAVHAAVNTALDAHGLIKIRVLSGDRDAREGMLQTLADTLNAAPIVHIGKLLVLWRPKPDHPKPVPADRMPGPRDVKVVKRSPRGDRRPEIKTLRVLGNQRLTTGGLVKRAKHKTISVKKRPSSR